MANQDELHAQESRATRSPPGPAPGHAGSPAWRTARHTDRVTGTDGERSGDVGGVHPGAEVTDRVRGLAVHRRLRPGAPRVVLVHGAMDRGASFIKASRRLPDLEIIRYDRRGYGRSVEVPPSDDLEVQVQDLEAIIGDTPSIVIGHSLGGVLALAVAARHPERVRAVGAYEAPMPWTDWWPAHSAGGDALKASAQGDAAAAAAERFMRRIVGDELWERLPTSTREARRAEGAALMADLIGMRSGTAPYELDQLRVPVVAGRSDRSDAHHQRAAETLAAEVDGAELVVIEDADHGAHYADPASFAAFISRTVARAT